MFAVEVVKHLFDHICSWVRDELPILLDDKIEALIAAIEHLREAIKVHRFEDFFGLRSL